MDNIKKKEKMSYTLKGFVKFKGIQEFTVILHFIQYFPVYYIFIKVVSLLYVLFSS